MNRLRLEHHLDHHPYWPDGVWIALYVDGRELTSRDWPSVVDLAQLQASVHEDGEFFIFTCECGEAECAGIEEPVTVTRDAEGVRWRLGDAWRFIGLRPESDRDWDEQVQEAAGGAAAGVPREFLFAHDHYAAAIEQDFDAAHAFVSRLDEFVTFTPDRNLCLLKSPDLPPEEALRRQAEELESWREQHPLPPGPARWGKLFPWRF
jgi:hypothetical protein